MAIAKIALLRKLPPDVDEFDYLIPDHLTGICKPGSVVEIPFRRSLVPGIVIKIQKHSLIEVQRLKSISGIYKQFPALRIEQFELAEFLRAETRSSYATIFNALIPVLTKKNTVLGNNKIPKSQKQYRTTLSICDKLTDQFCHAAKLAASYNGTVCIIAPDMNTLQQASIRIKLATSKKIIYAGKMHPQQKLAIWENACNGNIRLILGTRNALYLPFLKIDAIILLQEENDIHQRTEQHPDIDTRRIILFMQSQYACDVHLLSTTPSIETMHAAITSHWRVTHIQNKHFPHVSVIDSNVLLRKGQKRMLTDDLIEYLSAQQQPCFISFNRRGYAQGTTCAECRWQPKCPKCHSLRFSQPNVKNLVRCEQCKHEYLIPTICPSCGGVFLRVRAPGVQFFYQQLKKSLPKKRIRICEKNTITPTDLNEADIIIGTNYSLPRLAWNRINAVILLDCDNSIQMPDYRSAERTYSRIRLILAHMESGTCIIVTRFPSHSIFNMLEPHQIKNWYAYELSERKLLHFPPYVEFLLCEKNVNPKFSATEHVDEISRSIDHVSLRLTKKLTVLPLGIRSSKTQQAKFTALIRIPLPSSKTIFSEIQETLGDLWQITRNPIDLNS